MNSYYSILKFVNNSLSGEYIAIGLILVSNKNVFYKLSNNKISIANKLNPNSIKLLKFSLDNLNSYINDDIKYHNHELIEFDKNISVDFLNRLSVYNSGILQFSKPSMLKMEVNKSSFEMLFKDFIDEDDLLMQKEGKISKFEEKISKNLYIPLQGIIDVDYKLKKKSLPSLYFDFHFDSIGYNGALYASKAIDFNSQQVGAIRNDLSNYESLIQRLKPFVENKGIKGDHRFYIISDPYKGKTASYLEIYDMLSDKDNMPYFKLINTNNVDEIVSIINKKNASKFSKLLEE